MSQMHLPNIKLRAEPGQFNAILTLSILDIAPKGIYSSPLEKRVALKNMKFHQMPILYHMDKAISPK